MALLALSARVARRRRMSATLLALGAIALWATLASLGVALAHVPPFLLTGLALVIGSVPAWPLARQWRVPASTLALGVYGLFGFHFLLFVALRHAPPVEANLVNYLWPLLIVVLAPLFLPGVRCGRCTWSRRSPASPARRSRSSARRGVDRRLGLGLPAGAGLGLHLGQLFAADAARARTSRPRRSACSAWSRACWRCSAMRCSSRRRRCRRATGC